MQKDSLFAMAKQDTRCIPVCSAHPNDGEAAIAELRRIKELGGKIIKLHPATQNLTNSAGVALGFKGNLSRHAAHHNFGTLITISQGVPLETVSQIMGHKCIKMTQIYAKLTRQKLIQR